MPGNGLWKRYFRIEFCLACLMFSQRNTLKYGVNFDETPFEYKSSLTFLPHMVAPDERVISKNFRKLILTRWHAHQAKRAIAL